LESGSTGEVRQDGIGVEEVGNADCDGDDGQHPAVLDLFEVNGVVGDLKRSQIKSALRRHVQTSHVPYCSRGLNKTWTLGNALLATSHGLQRDSHHHDTKTSNTAWSSRGTSKLHDSRHQWPRDSSHQCQAKMVFTDYYMAHLSPGRAWNMLVAPVLAYNLALKFPCLYCRNHEVNGMQSRLLAMRTPWGAEVIAVDQVDHQQCPANVPGTTARQEEWSAQGGSIPDISILRATAFGDQRATEQVVWTLFLSVGICTGLLGAIVEGITDSEWDRPQGLDGWHRAVAAMVRKRMQRVYWGTRYRLAKRPSESWTAGLGPIVVTRLVSSLLVIPTYRSISPMNWELTCADGAGTTRKMVPPHDGGHILTTYTAFMEDFSTWVAEILLPHRPTNHEIE